VPVVGARWALGDTGFIWQLVGSLLAAPTWLLDITPFAHVGLVPTESFRAVAAAVMVALGPVAYLIGVALFGGATSSASRCFGGATSSAADPRSAGPDPPASRRGLHTCGVSVGAGEGRLRLADGGLGHRPIKFVTADEREDGRQRE
jgi:hypothetical protein